MATTQHPWCRTSRSLVALAALAALSLLAAWSASPAAAAGRDLSKWNVYTIDVGTGLAVYMEFPPDTPGERPVRVLYDAGKGEGDGLDNDIASFLSSPEIGLKPADGDFQGDVIDYFILSHPHEDHFNGGKPVFDCFDVRNVIESKQCDGIKYLKKFKGPAVNEIWAAKAKGHDAHFYLVGLPYPSGFDQPRHGGAYDEYAVCDAHLPPEFKGKIDVRSGAGKVTFPFGPDQVTQKVKVPIKYLMGRNEKSYRYITPTIVEGDLEVDVLPLGTQFNFGRYGGITLAHGDPIAAFDYADTTSETYKAAWPYYRECDVNDASIAVQGFFKNASIFCPGDCEGRASKPTTKVSLEDVLGSGEGADAYTRQDLEQYLRRDQPADQHLPLVENGERYVIDAAELRARIDAAFTTFDFLTPRSFDVTVGGEVVVIPAKSYDTPDDIPDAVLNLTEATKDLAASLHPKWRERLLKLHQDARLNKQKYNGLSGRFDAWVSVGDHPRLWYDKEAKRFRLEWKAKVWNAVTMAQVAEGLYYVDPGLANIVAGLLMRHPVFLEYMNPTDPAKRSMRGEKHMLDVADQIVAESGKDPLPSDVIFFGHHGSFTSSSIDFIHRVAPNVGIISADDKSYGGSTLPDFSALFWNLNTRHPRARAIITSLFLHADVLSRKRGEAKDEYAEKNRYSASASKILRARGRWPIPLWRTDLNDDLVDGNSLIDNIEIVTDGEKPIWDWARHRTQPEPQHPLSVQLEADMQAAPQNYSYFSLELVSANPSGGQALRPVDPSGEMRLFNVTGRLQGAAPLPDPDFGPESYREDWTKRQQ